MKKGNLLTITGNLWHFHPLGTGMIFSYNTISKIVQITCNATGKMINTLDKYREGGYDTPEQFKKACSEIYLYMINKDNVSLDLGYYEHPTYIGSGKIEIDLTILRN